MDTVKKVVERAKRLDYLKNRKKELEEELKTINKEKGLLEESVLPNLMEEHEIEKMTVDGVGTLYTQQVVYAHILAQDAPSAYDWFDRNGHGSLIKRTIHHSTLRTWVKEQLENGNEVPDFLHAKAATVARIRRK